MAPSPLPSPVKGEGGGGTLASQFVREDTLTFNLEP